MKALAAPTSSAISQPNGPPGIRRGTGRRAIFCALAMLAVGASARAGEEVPPIRVLLITGGCCHEYDYQANKLVEGTKARAHVEWKVLLDPRRGTRGEIHLYDDPKWAAGYDVVVHNECFADTADPEYIRKITEVHKAGVPAVVIHCAMHTYRAARIDDWREFVGVTSMHHEHQSEYPVRSVAPAHPIMQGFPDEWITPRDELYIIRKIWPNTKPLAVSKSERSGEEQPVFWTSQYGKARVFGTTYGHGNATFNDPVFINTLTRGLLWTVDKLNNEYLKEAEENEP
jgi:type 1 glutamine amidotransferase